MADPAPDRWCVTCGLRVTVSSGGAVHAGTGRRLGPDRHPVDPADAEPELWAAARSIERDYGGAFKVDARFGFLRADWSAGAAGRGTAAHFEAPDEAEMRRQLGEPPRRPG